MHSIQSCVYSTQALPCLQYSIVGWCIHLYSIYSILYIYIENEIVIITLLCIFAQVYAVPSFIHGIYFVQIYLYTIRMT